jgi:hypothetical protein
MIKKFPDDLTLFTSSSNLNESNLISVGKLVLSNSLVFVWINNTNSSTINYSIYDSDTKKIENYSFNSQQKTKLVSVAGLCDGTFVIVNVEWTNSSSPFINRINYQIFSNGISDKNIVQVNGSNTLLFTVVSVMSGICNSNDSNLYVLFYNQSQLRMIYYPQNISQTDSIGSNDLTFFKMIKYNNKIYYMWQTSKKLLNISEWPLNSNLFSVDAKFDSYPTYARTDTNVYIIYKNCNVIYITDINNFNVSYSLNIQTDNSSPLTIAYINYSNTKGLLIGWIDSSKNFNTVIYNISDSKQYLSYTVATNAALPNIISIDDKSWYAVWYDTTNYQLKMNILITCYRSCSTCNEVGDSISNKCTSCTTNYLSIDNSGKCYLKWDKVDRYYFDKSLNKFVNCSSNCLICDYNNGEICLKCMDNYFLNTYDKNCYSVTSYDSTKYTLDTIIQKIIPLSSVANTTLNCFETCKTCIEIGNSALHKCTSCKDNYKNQVSITNSLNCYSSDFKGLGYVSPPTSFSVCPSNCSECTANTCIKCHKGYYNVNGNCHQKNDNIQNHYYDASSNSFINCNTSPANYNCLTCPVNIQSYIPTYFQCSITQCYKSCDTCTFQVGTDSDHQCVTCKPNYIKALNTNNCYFKSQIIPNYYFDNTSPTFMPCNVACDYCFGNDNLKTMCRKCKTGYYPLEDDLTQCYQLGSVKGYYLESNIFKKCYRTCSSCVTLGDKNNHQCVLCSDGYYKKIDGIDSNCFYKGDILLYYFFDSSAGVFNKCNDSCLACDKASDNSSHNCLKCKQGLYNEPNTRSCYKDYLSGYYAHSNNLILYKCYVSCKECFGIGNKNEHKCKECKDGYTKYLYTGMCLIT